VALLTGPQPPPPTPPNTPQVLFCMYKVLDMDRMYFVQKANEWLRNCDFMYMEFTACMNVFTTPIPFAVRAGLASAGAGKRGRPAAAGAPPPALPTPPASL
jgi:hypothetical protein